ncbi:hypothetical protein HNR27_000386 [Ornithinibacillus bavariensis]
MKKKLFNIIIILLSLSTTLPTTVLAKNKDKVTFMK